MLPEMVLVVVVVIAGALRIATKVDWPWLLIIFRARGSDMPAIAEALAKARSKTPGK
jgi:hypothetical protein